MIEEVVLGARIIVRVVYRAFIHRWALAKFSFSPGIIRHGVGRCMFCVL